MALSPGVRLGPYEILALIGSGGMGEVYRARDAKLGRDVAIKVLPEAFERDAERMARFQREAKVLASLNHPNIATIHGLEDSDTTRALVMELVEGPTLADRIKAGAIPIDEALRIAKQICEGLEYAHERGIVHRDLKPSNVKVTNDDAVKILDFGLAKAIEGDASSIDIATSPTISRMATQAGVLLGTAAYISPEQAKGKPVDRRADIWAFGCVLYETLTGRMTFHGESVTDILAAVIKEAPDWSQLPAATPIRVRVLLQRCLQKDPKQRLRDIGDARISLDEVLSGAPDPPLGAASQPANQWPHWLAWGAVAVLAVGLALVGFLRFGEKPPAPAAASVIRFSVVLPQGQSVLVESPPQFAISPDGTRLAFLAKNTAGKYELNLRSLDTEEVKSLPSTGGNPFFSPDGEWLGMYSYTPLRRLEKLALSGGGPQPLCEVTGQTVATWPETNSLVLAVYGQGLFRVALAGGTPQMIGLPGTTQDFVWSTPEVLPEGKAILYTVQGDLASQKDIVAFDPSTHKAQTVIQQGVNPHYLEPGYLVFGRAGSIWGVPFDAEHLKLTGEPALLVEGVLVEQPGRGVEQFTLSKNGTLAYLAGASMEAQRQVVVVDEKGVAKTLTQDTKAFEDLSLSPDGSKVAMTVEGTTWSIWVDDIAGKTLRRLTFENDNRDPFWTPDGKRVVYSSLRGGVDGLYWRLADGSGSEEQLLSDKGQMYATSWSPDGKSLVYGRFNLATKKDETWILPLAGDRKPYPFLQAAFDAWFAALSPDGLWMAYESYETGRSEVYVKPFPGPGGKWQISTEGGERPEWSRDGKELFYLAGNQLMAVRVEAKPTFSAGRPEPLFRGSYLQTGHSYDVMPDGKHFVFIQTAQQNDRPTKINVVVNWREELERRLRGNKMQ